MSARDVLSDLEIFSDFPSEFLDHLASKASVERFSSGDVIVHEHDPAECFFVLTSGAVDVLHESAAANPIARLQPPGFFGEMAIMRDGTRTATVRAAGDVECLVISREDFEFELRHHPNEAAVLMPRLGRRIYAITHTRRPPSPD